MCVCVCTRVCWEKQPLPPALHTRTHTRTHTDVAALAQQHVWEMAAVRTVLFT